MEHPVFVIIGPTASGKTALGITFALNLIGHGFAAEIVNADSMLVYRGMDIGTAKPSLEERRGVVHHLIDVKEVNQSASMLEFRDLARQAIAEIRSRAGIPIVVGGSALYLHAIMDHMDVPPTDKDLRARLEQDFTALGAQVMYDRLAQANPGAAWSIGPTDRRRIIRALEAIELTGEFQSTLPAWTYELGNVYQIGLDISRQEMDQRIEARVERMFEQGFVDEVRRLIPAGIKESPTAAHAIGYHQILDYLDGLITEDQAKESTIIKTRQFSRKQLSWWRRDTRIAWLNADVDANELYTEYAGVLESLREVTLPDD
ncbi:MAG: tRNA (adenosine(37)-N6)-dimethylallyltransferase MiaA [Propionibacteriaceae bacterium]|nr:tRNA (adenosine(37)-N6)-dimethylallyltransferase MiaA [Propionibacteriaceae bacterium]